MTTTYQPNARFWVMAHGQPVKLTLRPGQRIEHVEGGPTDEGYSWDCTAWEYPADELAVYREWCVDGCDCDGRLTRSGTDRCDCDGLRAGNWPYIPEGDPDAAAWAGVRWPAWRKARPVRVYDQFAQAAGY